MCKVTGLDLTCPLLVRVLSHALLLTDRRLQLLLTSGSSTGMATRKVEPRPRPSDCTPITPPCCFTISREIHSPSPEPPVVPDTQTHSETERDRETQRETERQRGHDARQGKKYSVVRG